LRFSANCFVGLPAKKQFSRRRNHFQLFEQTSGNTGWVSIRQQNGGTAPASDTGDSQMRTLSFILAFGFVLVGPSIAGSSDTALPGIGTFAYNGAPMVPVAQAIVVATR
jgi:hypothetical protein